MSTPYLEPIKTTVVLTGEFIHECVCSNNKNTVTALLATTLVSDKLQLRPPQWNPVSIVTWKKRSRKRPRPLLGLPNGNFSQGLFTWSGGPRSSGVGFFCFHALGNTKQKKPTPLDRGPPLHVNRVLVFLPVSDHSESYSYKSTL